MLEILKHGVLLACLVSQISAIGLLYPRDSPTRETKSLDGIWRFRLTPKDDPDLGFKKEWFNSDWNDPKVQNEIIPMPVPSSFNDITQDRHIRDFLGWAW